MPICDNKNKSLPIKTEIDHRAEAANVKKSREQAYFNSYNFDAIEKFVDLEKIPNQKIKTSEHLECTDHFDLNTNTNKYIKCLANYFISNGNNLKSLEPDSLDCIESNHKIHLNGSEGTNSCSSNSAKSCHALYGEIQRNLDNRRQQINNFLLPRPMLKYQSEMSILSPETYRQNLNNTKDESIQPTMINGYDRTTNSECVIPSSHYSTEKSGSSGYYSSNLCSTSSIEEHIYCEPVSTSLPITKSLELIKLPQELIEVLPKDENMTNRKQSKIDFSNENVTENLRILETSIENLDRHLRNYPKFGSINSNRHQFINQSIILPLVNNCCNNNNNEKTKCGQLPTIMEGNDGQNTTKASTIWSDEMDDSLMDVDLGSFLLSNKLEKLENNVSNTLNGIDNPIFNKNKILDEETLENNYKCSKYVNSCPDNAYNNVESIIDTIDDNDVQDNSLSIFLKEYEDQLHFQNTKDMLVDIRDKLKSIVQIKTNENNCKIPKELENNISCLRMELEDYLKIMNHKTEMDLKKLCVGLVNNEKLVTITKAFERQKIHISNDNDNNLIYEPIIIKNNNCNSAIKNFNEINSNTIECSDPNFQLKKKSINEFNSIKNLFNDNNCECLECNKNCKLKELDIRKHRYCSEPDKDSYHDWHRNKPSIWELYYGTNRLNQTLTGKRGQLVKNSLSSMSYPSSRPESDFTLDLPKAEQLRLKMDKEKKFRRRCRILTTFFSLIFFLLTVMVVSLVLTRGKRMFGSML